MDTNLSDPSSITSSPSTSRRAPSPAVAIWALAVVVGSVVGVTTCWLQSVLPGSGAIVANAAAAWPVVAVAVAACVRGAGAVPVAAGAAALLGEVVGYYVFGAVSGIALAGTAEHVLWAVAALTVGPLAGFAGGTVRSGGADQRVVAITAVCGTLVGEGLVLAVERGEAAGWAETVIGLLVAGAALAAVPATGRARCGAVAVGAAVSVGTCAAFVVVR